MKIKMLVTFSGTLLKCIIRLRRAYQNRKDLMILNSQAEYFHAEMMDVLGYQVDV